MSDEAIHTDSDEAEAELHWLNIVAQSVVVSVAAVVYVLVAIRVGVLGIEMALDGDASTRDMWIGYAMVAGGWGPLIALHVRSWIKAD